MFTVVSHKLDETMFNTTPEVADAACGHTAMCEQQASRNLVAVIIDQVLKCNRNIPQEYIP